MYFSIKSNILYREYDLFGYITDNRNFGYEFAGDHKKDIGDKIVSKSGSLFLSVLNREPLHIDVIVKELIKLFNDVDEETIKKDALEFYGELVVDGFLTCGNSIEECLNNDVTFQYEKVKANEIFTSSAHKIKDTQDFFEEKFDGKPQLTNVHIEITSMCNERCIHCYIPHEKKTVQMSKETFYDILQQCREMKVLHINISGGEPMLHPNFLDFIKKCNAYNFSVNVLSNLTLLNEEIVVEMQKNPLLGVQTSLYSMKKDVHDDITKMPGSYEKAIRGIMLLKKYNIPLQISCPIMKQNQNEYDDVVEWGKQNNINVGSDYVIIGQYDSSTQNLNNRLSICDVEKIIRKKANDDPNYVHEIEKETDKRKTLTADDYICSVCHSSICIAENGNVYPCAGWQGYVIGNIKDTLLEELWNGSKKIKGLRELRRRDFPKCVNCAEKEFCTMCMVRNANESTTGDYLKVNEYFCEIAKITKNIVMECKKCL